MEKNGLVEYMPSAYIYVCVSVYAKCIYICVCVSVYVRRCFLTDDDKN